MRSTTRGWALGLILTAALPTGAHAATPAAIQQDYATAARGQVPGFAGFSAERGAAFFRSTHGNDWSCASCHTEDPKATGRHAKTSKSITPLAPAANAERFTDPAQVEKWFKRNCNDVLGRTCTVQEKGDVLQYLMSVK
jgi:hypothetical protein